MPYIKESNRANLDVCIEHMMRCLRDNIPANPHSNRHKEKISNEEFLSICGDINYAFSRILSGTMGDISYPKIAVITGVLENIKQEFYRRVATTYENKKIAENGDIREYKLL